MNLLLLAAGFVRKLFHVPQLFLRSEIRGGKKGVTGEQNMYPQGSPRKPLGEAGRPGSWGSDL